MKTNRHPEVTLSEQDFHKKSRRGFLLGGVAAVAALGGYEAMRHAREDDDVPWPQRRVLDLNGRLWHSYLDNAHLMPTYPDSAIGYLKANGEYGLDEENEDGY